MIGRYLHTFADVAACVRGRRAELGWTQTSLATKAGVSRKFVSELEAGHPRAELDKVLAVLDALDVTAYTIPNPPTPPHPPTIADYYAQFPIRRGTP